MENMHADGLRVKRVSTGFLTSIIFARNSTYMTLQEKKCLQT